MALQVQSVIAYCTLCGHVLWDVHEDDTIITGNSSGPQIMPLDALWNQMSFLAQPAQVCLRKYELVLHRHFSVHIKTMPLLTVIRNQV